MKYCCAIGRSPCPVNPLQSSKPMKKAIMMPVQPKTLFTSHEANAQMTTKLRSMVNRSNGKAVIQEPTTGLTGLKALLRRF